MSNIQHGTRNVQVFDCQLIMPIQSNDFYDDLFTFEEKILRGSEYQMDNFYNILRLNFSVSKKIKTTYAILFCKILTYQTRPKSGWLSSTWIFRVGHSVLDIEYFI